MGSDFGLRGLGGTYLVKSVVYDLVAGIQNAVNDLGTNPENQDVSIIEAILYISTTAAAGSMVLDIGVDDDGDVKNDGIFDAIDDAVGITQATATGLNATNALVTWTEGYHLVQTNTVASGASLVGKLAIIYLVEVGKGAGEVA